MLSDATVQAIRDKHNAKVEKAWCAQKRFHAKKRDPASGGEMAALFPIFWMCWNAQCKIAYRARVKG